MPHPPRSATPTKDEIYQHKTPPPQPPLPPTSPQFMHQSVPQPPSVPPPQVQYHPMFQMQPPPPPPLNMMSMPPHLSMPPAAGTSQIMIDPTSYHQNYMYNQPPPPQLSPQSGYQYSNQQTKMMISPVGSNNSISPTASLKSQSQLNSPGNQNSGEIFF